MPRHEPGLTLLTRASGRGRWAKPHLVLLAAALFAIPTLITLNLKHAGENVVRAESQLQSYISEMQIQDGLEWRIISGRVPQKDVREELAASRRRASEHLTESVAVGLSAATAANITTLTRRYEQVVDEEMGLLGAGRTQDALRLDRTRVDPMFDQVTRFLDVQTSRLSTDAGRAQRLGDAGVLVTVLLSLILVSFVQSRRRRVEVRNQATLQSEARYRTLIERSSDLVLVVDRAGLATFASPSAERILMYDDRGRSSTAASAAAGADPVDFLAAIDPRDRAPLLTALQATSAGSRSIG